MPANKNSMRRCDILDSMLLSGKPVSVSDMRERLEREFGDSELSVSDRCIQKDLVYLNCGEPLDSEDGNIIRKRDVRQNENDVRYSTWVYQYVPDYPGMFRHDMNESEKKLLDTVFKLVGNFEGLPGFEEVAALGKAAKVVADDRKIVSVSRNDNIEGSNLFGFLFKNISEQTPISLTYHFHDNPDNLYKDVIFHPYLLKEYNRRWFVLGKLENPEQGGDRVGEGGLLALALDCIVGDPKPADVPFRTFDHSVYGRPEEFFDDIVGTTNKPENQVLPIVFWASGQTKGYIENKPIHMSQKMLRKDEAKWREQRPDLKGGAFFEVRCKRNYEIKRELCSFGDGIEVLSPKEMRDAVIDWATRLCKVYCKG